MNTMTLSEAAIHIGELIKEYGDVPLVLWDMDSGSYFSLSPDNFEVQQMKNGKVRVSVGPNSYQDKNEQKPEKRPL